LWQGATLGVEAKTVHHKAVILKWMPVKLRLRRLKMALKKTYRNLSDLSVTLDTPGHLYAARCGSIP
jgi:hypothetical protein